MLKSTMHAEKHHACSIETTYCYWFVLNKSCSKTMNKLSFNLGSYCQCHCCSMLGSGCTKFFVSYFLNLYHRAEIWQGSEMHCCGFHWRTVYIRWHTSRDIRPGRSSVRSVLYMIVSYLHFIYYATCKSIVLCLVPYHLSKHIIPQFFRLILYW